MLRNIGIASFLLFGALLCASCRTAPPAPSIGGIYRQAAKCPCFERDPVVVIHGIMGSRLADVRTGKVVWGAFGGDWADPTTLEGVLLTSVPMEFGTPLEDLTDSVIPDGALGTVDVNVLGLPVRLQAYASIMNALGVGGYQDEALHEYALDYGREHFTCFQFAYDWRLSSMANAQKLHQYLEEKAAYIKAQSAKLGVTRRDVKFEIVAHSMGGLIARYQLMYGAAPLPGDGRLPELTWAGAKLVKRVTLVGTPNAGSADSLLRLVNGFDRPGIPPYSPALLGTFPSVYELLPRVRHDVLTAADDGRTLNHLDPRLWQDLGWGLADPWQDHVLRGLLPGVWNPIERRRTALEHQRKCLRRAALFHAALDRQAELPDGLRINLIAGDAIPTVDTLAVDTRTGQLAATSTSFGDGTVLRASALFDERPRNSRYGLLISPIDWEHVIFLPFGHSEMTRQPVFTDNLLFQLLEQP